jgi:hypothetical protein
MNIVQLRAQIAAYCENAFLQSAGGVPPQEQIDTFIQQAEQRIYNSVQFPSLRKNVTGFTTINNKYLSCPLDFLAVYSIAVIDLTTGAYDYLLNKDVNFIREAFPFPAVSGKPTHYALFGPATTNTNPAVITNELTFLLGPTPDATYNVELHYYYYPESITTAAGGTTWLSDNFDSVLLYGSLLEAATYMKEANQETLANYTKRYDEAMALAKRLGDGLERGDAYRNGQARYPVK